MNTPTATVAVRLRIDASKTPAGVLGELRDLIKDFPGESPVLVDCLTSEGPKCYAFGPGFRVQPNGDFYAEVRALLGESALV